MKTNNITRMLDNRKIRYTTFELPPEKMGADQVADLLGVPPAIVFKSIVLLRRGTGKPILAVVPGDREVATKKLAQALREKKVSPASQKEAEELTGLQAGGISPLALINHGFQILIDRSALGHKQVHVSGGELGLNIRLDPLDLVQVTGARTADIC